MYVLAETFRWCTMVVLVAVAVGTIRGAVRGRDRATLFLGAAIALLAAAAVLARVDYVMGYGHRAVGAFTLVAFAASGLALVEYRTLVLGRRTAWNVIVLGALVGSGALAVAVGVSTDPDAVRTPAIGAARALLGLSWAVAVGEAAVRFWMASRSRALVARMRLRMLAMAYLAATGVLAVGVIEPPDARAVGLRGMVFGMALALAAGAAPPRWMRRRWLQRASVGQASALVPVGAWYWDVPSNLVVWSDRLHDVYGTDPSTFEATYDAFIELVHPDDRGWVGELIGSAFASGGPFAFDHRIVTPSGEVRWLHGRGEVLTEPATGATTAMFGTAHDITERKLAEVTLSTALDREREATERLRHVDRMKDAFLEAVSHELRTPLTAVLGLGSTLELDSVHGDPAQVRHIAGRIVANAQRLDRLLSDLLDLDRISRGVLEPDRLPTRLDDLVRTTAQAIPTRGHPVVVDADPVEIAVGRPQVERIVENLVANAIRHTPPSTTIWVRVRAHDEGAEIVVSDDGPGVPDGEKVNVFEPFARGEGAAARAGGSGIGLSLVARFAELHGGRAWVADRDGGGASFHVVLPDADVPEITTAQRSRVR